MLVVGSGQSGCQLAEELHLAGRDVFLACGRAPWLRGGSASTTCLWWALETGFLDRLVEALPAPAARLASNLQAIRARRRARPHYRTLQALGVTLVGHFLGASGRRAGLPKTSPRSVAWGDARHADFMGLVTRTCDARGLAHPPAPAPEPFRADGAPEELDLGGVGAVIFATGYRPAYGWIDVPGAFDELGFPRHENGRSTAAPGLYFAGVHFLRKRKSSLLIGVGEDAALVASSVAA